MANRFALLERHTAKDSAAEDAAAAGWGKPCAQTGSSGGGGPAAAKRARKARQVERKKISNERTTGTASGVVEAQRRQMATQQAQIAAMAAQLDVMAVQLTPPPPDLQDPWPAPAPSPTRAPPGCHLCGGLSTRRCFTCQRAIRARLEAEHSRLELERAEQAQARATLYSEAGADTRPLFGST